MRGTHSLLLLPNEPEVVGSSSGIGLVLVGGGPALSTRNERNSLYINEPDVVGSSSGIGLVLVGGTVAVGQSVTHSLSSGSRKVPLGH